MQKVPKVTSNKMFNDNHDFVEIFNFLRNFRILQKDEKDQHFLGTKRKELIVCGR